ncbi:hypothetical protein [Xanthomonas vesicatoria]|uniref:Lipoprotein n=1 Tax=Xanthomonas vesicatoria TaxID=56460 RepID=A0ABS8LFW2_9XANT|nr:hypothetical protein [Xanthomonas vesicatoria]MCC8624035.1 hypothetical protein [Xanthomonas vesicatoria]MCC8696039.1 hypothetical protein [Xanthomonas vesicatoria]MCC8704185.1 hypothetical protein [Xanthomonas vesicatoria]
MTTFLSSTSVRWAAIATLFALSACERNRAPASPSPAAAIAASATTPARVALTLHCPDLDDAVPEAAAITAGAGDRVRRVGAHRLEVTTDVGTQVFADSPPYDEPLDGAEYRYCDRGDAYVLLHHRDGDSFGGVLIDIRSGRQLPGGIEVVIAPDRSRYLAVTQSDGMDGEQWRVLDFNKRPLISTTSMLLSQDGATGIAELSAPTWFGTQLQATATCLSDDTQQWQVRLTNAQGAWNWQPRRACDATDAAQ